MLTERDNYRKDDFQQNKLTVQTKNSAVYIGNRYPLSILRKIDPGIANVCRLLHGIE